MSEPATSGNDTLQQEQGVSFKIRGMSGQLARLEKLPRLRAFVNQDIDMINQSRENTFGESSLMPVVQVILFSVALFLFFGLEIYLASRQKKDADDSQDAESLKKITRLRNVSFIIGIISTVFPILPVPGSRDIHLLAGAALIMAGFIIRSWSIATLGRYFTSVVMTHADQSLITSGPYKFLRHPGYTGGLLFYLGIGMATGSISGLVLIMFLMAYGIDQRIKVEERVMISFFGEEYIEYMKTTKRLIPLLY